MGLPPRGLCRLNSVKLFGGLRMMTNIRTVLLIDDSPAHAQAFSEALLTVKDGPRR